MTVEPEKPLTGLPDFLEQLVGSNKGVVIETPEALITLERLTNKSLDWAVTIRHKAQSGTKTEKYELKNDRGLVGASVTYFLEIENIADINFGEMGIPYEDGADCRMDIDEESFEDPVERAEFNARVSLVLYHLETNLETGEVRVLQ